MTKLNYKPKIIDGKWFIEVNTETFGDVLLIDKVSKYPIPITFDNEEDALKYIDEIVNENKPKQIYSMYLNGNFYGSGRLDYMKELFIDYVVTCEMYEKEEVTITIRKKAGIYDNRKGD